MIDIFLYDIFDHNKNTLKETSKNDCDRKNIYYMTDSELEVIDFDAVKNDYIKNLRLEKTPKSNDVLFVDDDVEMYFIEFKSGNMDKEIYDVRRKIFESLLIFTDIMEKGISYTRQNLNYILVYRKEYNINDKNRLTESEIQDAKGIDDILRDINRLSNQRFDNFKLRKQFERLYFKKVYTYTEEEFEEEFVKRYA